MGLYDPVSISLKNNNEIVGFDNPLPVTEKPPLDIRYDPDDSLPTYIGLNFGSYNASTSAATWTIFKYTYSSSKATRIQRRDNVAWDNRASLF